MTTLKELEDIIKKTRETYGDDIEVIFSTTLYPEKNSDVYTVDYFGRSYTQDFGDNFLFFLNPLKGKEDNWDILKLDENMDNVWPHIALLNRLHDKNIDCFFADMWRQDEIAFLVGCNSNSTEIANALNMHKKAIYVDQDHCFVILNLYQEKMIRKEKGDEK